MNSTVSSLILLDAKLLYYKKQLSVGVLVQHFTSALSTLKSVHLPNTKMSLVAVTRIYFKNKIFHMPDFDIL